MQIGFTHPTGYAQTGFMRSTGLSYTQWVSRMTSLGAVPTLSAMRV
jgi:hypothetical protein